MTCPKCQGEMRSYERNGVLVDQCGDCRGLFLDRGELERLVEAESSHYREAPAPAREERHDDRDRDRDRDRDAYRQQPHKKKKRNFLEELFD